MSHAYKSRKSSPPRFRKIPSGKSGGKAGTIRGDISESMVSSALALLKSKGKIIRFYKDDGEGKDFVVWVWKGPKKKQKRCPVTIEAKSSMRGVQEYLGTIKKKGKIVADIIVVANEGETFFTVAHNIEEQLSCSNYLIKT